MNEPSVRERIKGIQNELTRGALTPDLARESLVRLTALLGHVNDAQRAADGAYKLVLLDCMKTETAAARARIAAEATPAYGKAKETKDLAALVLEMIRSCRAYLRSLDEEMRLAR